MLREARKARVSCDFTFASRTQRAQWGLALMLMPAASIGSSVANKGGVHRCWTLPAVEHTDNEASCKLYLTVGHNMARVGNINLTRATWETGTSRASFGKKVLPDHGSQTFSLSSTPRRSFHPIIALPKLYRSSDYNFSRQI